MQGQYSLRSPAVKRLMKEAQELKEPTEQYFAQPLDDNLFEWHFTIRGPQDTEFENGIYHGRIILPPEYPMKPPNIVLLTANGRFETFKKICLSISGFHPESWQPSWSIRTALLAIVGFMPTHGNGAIGSLDYTADERKQLARKSQDYKCELCGSIKAVLLTPTEKSKETQIEAKKLASQMSFHGEKEKKPSTSNETNTDSSHQGAAQSDKDNNVSTNEQTSETEKATADIAANSAENGAGSQETESSVRQRNIQSNNPVNVTTNNRTVTRQRAPPGGTGSLALIILLTTAIVLLLFRRLYVTGSISFHEL